MLTTLGDRIPCGAYLLSLRIAQRILVSFGKLRQGQPIPVDPGHYLYVGSAMGSSGSASLGRRLVRHATRSADLPAHAICTELAHELAACGLRSPQSDPPAQKRLHWHIDYLLDRREVELSHVFVLRSAIRREDELAQRLAAEPGIRLFRPGIGASDAASASHLFQVTSAATDYPRLVSLISEVCS